ncbi:unnamed protein product [Prunus armeniaca]
MRQHAAFNGKPEYSTHPEPLTGEEVLHMVEDGDRKYLPVRHVLDVMHIEKNVCDSIIGTLLEIPGKNKDEIAARLNLLNMGVKTDLQPEYGERRTRLPPGPWNLSRAEKREVCNSFYGMKIPEDSRLLGLKSHDCHTLMQQLLLVAIRSVLEKPARWMYPFERYMKVLKGYVQNRARPEGCIVEWYIAEEVVEFYTEHLFDVSTVGVPSSQKMGVSKPLLGCTVSVVDRDLLNQTHLYVLENTEEVLPYIEYVQSELNEEDNHGVSENLRWLAAGPNMVVPSYRSYLIKGGVRIECEPFTRGIPNVDTFDELVGEFGSQNIRDGCEDIWIE